MQRMKGVFFIELHMYNNTNENWNNKVNITAETGKIVLHQYY